MYNALNHEVFFNFTSSPKWTLKEMKKKRFALTLFIKTQGCRFVLARVSPLTVTTGRILSHKFVTNKPPLRGDTLKTDD